MLHPLPYFLLADFQELDFCPDKIAITVPFVFGNSRICFMFELPNLHLNVLIVCFIIYCQNIDMILPRSRFILMSGSKKILPVDGAEHCGPFHADHAELLVIGV